MSSNEITVGEEEGSEYKDQSTFKTDLEFTDLSYVNIEEEKKAKENLIHDILVEFGAPLLTVELTPEQIDRAIEDAILVYTRLASFPPQYLGIDLGAYVTHQGINLKKYNIAVIQDIAFGGPGMFGLSTSELTFGYSGYISNRPIWQPFDFVSLECLHEFKEMAQRMLAPKPDWTFVPQTGILKIVPEPQIMYRQHWHLAHDLHQIHIPAIIDCEIEPPLWQLYSNDFVRRLSVANAKTMLGTIRSKFNGINLPGGGQLNGETLRQEGINEAKEVIAEIKAETSYGTHFIIV